MEVEKVNAEYNLWAAQEQAKQQLMFDNIDCEYQIYNEQCNAATFKERRRLEDANFVTRQMRNTDELEREATKNASALTIEKMKVEMLKSNVDENILKFEALETAKTALKGRSYDCLENISTAQDDIAS